MKVGPKGEYATLKEAVDWFNANATSPYEIYVDCGDNLISDTIVVDNTSADLEIRGFASNVTYLSADTGLANKPMFDLRTGCFIYHLTATGSTLAGYGLNAGENFVTLNQTSDVYYEFVDIIIDHFTTGISDQMGNTLYIFNFCIDTCITCIEINYTTTGIATQSLDAEVGDFSNYTTAIALTHSGVAHGFQLMHLIFINNAGNTAVSYGGTNFLYDPTQANIFNCAYSEIGNFVSGFDFTIVRDSNVVILGNVGVVDKTPHAKINVVNNVSTTTVTTAGIYYKFAFTNGFTFACKIGLTNGRMTYYPSYPYDVTCFLTGSIQVNNNNRSITTVLRRSIAITSVTGNGATVTVTTASLHNLQTGSVVQMLGWTGGTGTWNRTGTVTVISTTVFRYTATGNGTATGGTAGSMLSEMTIRTATATQPYPFTMFVYLENMTQNEYIEPYVTSAASADVVTIQDLQWILKI
jgi:hypothetical protein